MKRDFPSLQTLKEPATMGIFALKARNIHEPHRLLGRGHRSRESPYVSSSSRSFAPSSSRVKGFSMKAAPVSSPPLRDTTSAA